MKGNAVFENLRRIQRNRELNGERGFTLIELLIVIVVLGILAAIVVFALGGVTSSSAAAACATDAQSVNVAIAAEQAATPTVAPTYSVTAGVVTSNLVPTYLATWPSSSYYVVSLTGTTTQVALVTGDPGVAPSPTPTVAGPGTTAQTFNGSSAYAYPTTGAVPWPSSLAGKGICAGA